MSTNKPAISEYPILKLIVELIFIENRIVAISRVSI